MEMRARSRPVGRILRFLLGAAFLLWAIPPRGAPGSAILLAVATAVALLLFYLLVHRVLARRARRLGTWPGVLVAAGPAALIFGKDAHLPCLLFSPIDALERKAARTASGNDAS